MPAALFLLDTNVVIGLLKADAACVALVQAANCDMAQMAVSQITRMELLGFADLGVHEEQTIGRFLAAVQVFRVGDAIEAVAIKLRRSRKIKLPDAIIAATAISQGMTLLTLDKALNQALA
jgi:predicted nucleic acid-binding protein